VEKSFVIRIHTEQFGKVYSQVLRMHSGDVTEFNSDMHRCNILVLNYKAMLISNILAPPELMFIQRNRQRSFLKYSSGSFLKKSKLHEA
jgi:hypothetical protein